MKKICDFIAEHIGAICVVTAFAIMFAALMTSGI